MLVTDIWMKKFAATYKMINQSVESFNDLFTQAETSLRRIVRSQKKISKIALRKAHLEAVDFNARAFAVCHEIFRMIQSAHDTKDHLVSLMCRFSGMKGQYIKMIAYGSNGNRQPNTYSDTFAVPVPALNKGTFYHQRVFSEGSNDIHILEDNAAIRREFDLKGKVHERDSKMQQYIGLPIMNGSNGTVALLQVDGSKKNQFGSNRDDILFFAETILVPFTQLLLYYLQDATVAGCMV